MFMTSLEATIMRTKVALLNVDHSMPEARNIFMVFMPDWLDSNGCDWILLISRSEFMAEHVSTGAHSRLSQLHSYLPQYSIRMGSVCERYSKWHEILRDLFELHEVHGRDLQLYHSLHICMPDMHHVL